MFYASRGEELAALERAARRVGCRLESTALEDIDGEPGVRASIDCGDGWTAARLLLALAAEDARTPGARELASTLRAVSGGSDAGFARAVHRFVRDRVAFRREDGELFQSPAVTLRRGLGDCDCQFRLAYALARAGGLRASMGLLHDRESFGAAGWPSHVAPILHDGAGAWWAETTVAARYGEHPMDAARRLGVVGRGDLKDLKEGLQVMDEDDLPPVPSGFEDRNPTARVELDAEALARLGYLEAGFCPMAAGDPVFRRAVVAFQRDRGLLVDGLIGPHTREEIDRALREAGPPVNHAFPYLGAVAERPKRPLTAHLSDRFFVAAIALAAELRALGARIDVRDLLAVWLAESGIRADLPNAAGAPFYGLNQLGLPMHARMVRWLGTAADYLGLDAADQVPYVGRYYKGIGSPSRLVDAGSLYLANFLPAFLAHTNDPEFVLAEKGEKDVHGWYRWNASLDMDKDGKIQVRDLAAAVEAAKRARAPYWAEVLARLEAVEQHGPDDPPSPAGTLAALGAVLAVLGAGAWAVSRVIA